jgi:hypothetical protein
MVFAWWLFLIAASLLNIFLWFREKSAWGGLAGRFSDLWRAPLKRSSMIWLSSLYVFGCALRAVFPKADVERFVLFDSWFSSVFVGRSVATIAEVAFAAQWSIFIRELGSPRLARTILGCVMMAELWSWYSVITTHFLGNCIEESLWGVAFALVSTVLWRSGRWIMAAGCTAYVAFMALVDVPMYLNRLELQVTSGAPHLYFWEGLRDLNTRWVVTWSVENWQSEFAWMGLYFSVAVLMSIWLCRDCRTNGHHDRSGVGTEINKPTL